MTPVPDGQVLTRRTMLRVGGAGVIALTFSLELLAAPAARAAAVRAQLHRSTYVALVGSSFAVDGSPSLTLVSVGDLSGGRPGDDDAFSLIFSGPVAQPLESALHWIDVPGSGVVPLFISPVAAPAADLRYEVVVDRSVGTAAALDAPEPLRPRTSMPAPEATGSRPAASGDASTAAGDAATAAVAATAAGAAPGDADRAQAAVPASKATSSVVAATPSRLRVKAHARRVDGVVELELVLPGRGVRSATVRLVRDGLTYASGAGKLRGGRAELRLRQDRRTSRGRYDLVLTVTDHAGVATTVLRSVVVR